MEKIMTCLVAGICLFLPASRGQSVDSLAGKLADFPSKFFNKIQGKEADLNKQLSRQTEKYMKKLAAREARLQKELYNVDSVAAKRLFGQSASTYATMTKQLNKDSGTLSSSIHGQYLANLDSERVSLTYLQQHPELLGNSANPADLQKSIDQIRQLQTRLAGADDAQAFIGQRKEEIREYLSRMTQMPPGLGKAYQGFNEDQYYYAQQVEQYRQMMNDPDKLFKKALSLLDQLPSFRQFMQNNSQLASLFGIPGNSGSAMALAGLQTRDQLQQMVQGQISAGGPNAISSIQQNFESAQSQLDQYKDKLTKLGAGGPDVDIPNFSPNQEKTKTFLGRLEYGANLQTTRNNYFPVTTDIGLSVGYKLGKAGTIGVGASYKIGWGADIQHIAVTGQGAGLRSFLDIKLKGSFYASGGYEYNYQPVAPGPLLSALTQTGVGTVNWTRSGLIGLSKIVSLRSKLFRKTKLQLLWDFLSYQQIPRTQPILFRVGYLLN